MVVIVALVFLQVLNRYIFKVNIAWALEISNMAFVWMIFVGGAVGVKRNSHLAIDVFLAFLPPRARRIWNSLVQLLVAVFLVAFVWIGGQFVRQSAQTTSTYLNWPMTYVYGVLPLSGLIMLYYALKNALRCLERIGTSARFEV
ncbi:MAG: TRAP transporter small permease [Candidatus Deferrimicrobium sp.]